MLIKVTCDWCGKEYTIQECDLKRRKHHFCSRECFAAFSNKSKNPEGYNSLKDYTNIGAALSRLNQRLNPTRMTPETREKLRIAHIGAGEGKTYAKRYGRHEHRVVAEQILGRPLLPGEIVHHEDGNKRNNDPKNIYVFASQSEHARYHMKMRQFFRDLDEIEAEEGGDAQ